MAHLSFLLLPLAFALVLADTGYYVPKAFYTIDKYGHESAPVLLTGMLRPRRSTFSTASASSSSSSNSNGFGHTQTFAVSSGVPVYADPYVVAGLSAAQPVYTNSYDSGYSQPGSFQGNPVVVSRFGDESGVQGIGITGTSQGGNGVFSSSSSTLGSDGRVHYTTQTGKFRK